MPRRLLILAAFALLIAPAHLAAQGRAGAVELGFDGGFEFSNVEDLDFEDADGDVVNVEFGDQTNIGIPIQRFRVGYHATDYFSIEPSIGLDFQKIEDPTDDSDDDDISRTNLDLALALLLHFRADPDNPVVYGLLRGSYDMIDQNIGEDDDDTDEFNEESQSQIGVAAGIGIKLPVAEKLDVRLEGAYERRFENEDDFLPASNNYQLNVGFSWYTGDR